MFLISDSLPGIGSFIRLLVYRFENGGGISTVRTGDLPDGVPEDELRDAKDHKIGHLQLAKKTMDS